MPVTNTGMAILIPPMKFSGVPLRPHAHPDIQRDIRFRMCPFIIGYYCAAYFSDTVLIEN